MSALDLATDGLAAHRLTQLVVDDLITAPLRARVDRWLAQGQHYTLREGLQCSWCVGVWVGFGVAVARTIAPRQWAWVARALALADLAGLIATASAPT